MSEGCPSFAPSNTPAIQRFDPGELRSMRPTAVLKKTSMMAHPPSNGRCFVEGTFAGRFKVKPNGKPESILRVQTRYFDVCSNV